MSHAANAQTNGAAAPPHPANRPNARREATDARSNHRIQRREPIQRKLLIRVVIPALAGLVQLALASVAIVVGNAPAVILLWTLPALVAGYGFGRMARIAWDSDRAQVSLLQVQLLVTIAYIVVRIGTHVAIERTLGVRAWVADTILLISFGLFFGRSIGLAVQIRRALASRDSADPVSIGPS